jgi:hypothetical protein
VLLAVAVVVGLLAVLTGVPGSPVQRIFMNTFRGQEVALAPRGDPTPGVFSAPSSSGAAPGDPPAARETATPAPAPRTVQIITVLPKDAIPAILDPRFVSGEEAEAQMSPSERVLGVSINGDHRAYSVPTLSSHEVVNDVVGGVPVAVTW